MKHEMHYLDGLNEPQKEGVVNTEGPAMIIAGAGSGKTRVLTYRIAHLVHAHKVDPFNILALTFTNKAALEMRHRIEQVIGTEARNLWMGTFHSVFARILRAEAGYLGYPGNFTIYDTDDSKSLIKTIVKEQGLDDKVYKANVVLNRISGAKNRMISWQAYISNPDFIAEDEANMKSQMGKLYRIYTERCKRAGAMDFDDLLFNTNILFKNHIDVLNKYQHRFNYVLVDEFQDTNYSQYIITRKLAAVHQNICVVGDDAQSIYAFRGADIQNILNFEKDYSVIKIIKLEQNYRSTQNIVNAANSVIARNRAQIHKQVWTSNQPGELINLLKAASDHEEGRLVASSIFEEKMQKKLHNSDFAVLYRTNSQSRAIEEALRRVNVKYKIVGGLSFYQRREIKDLLAYLCFTINHNDEESFKRIVNLPKRGVGPGTINKILVAAEEHAISIWEVLENIHRFIHGKVAATISGFVTLIKRFELEVNRKDAFEAATIIARESGILKELYEDKTIEGLSRYENVQELLNAVKEFVDNSDNKDVNLGAFLQEVSLLTGVDTDKSDDNNVVTLMTIHMAKGLEFKNIYIVGLEEDLFPSQMMLSSRADLEEERRLYYVAITRAKEKLTLSYALTRYRFGRLKNCEPSRFLEEIDPKYIQIDTKFSFTEPSIPNRTKSFINSVRRDVQKKNANAFKNTGDYTVPPGFEPSDTSVLEIGMKVEHPKFGFGKVLDIDENDAGRKAKVKFDNFGEKTLLLSFAKLRIHN